MKFEIGNGEFHVGDCFDVMRELPDASVDLVVTSPPYDNLRTYNDGDAWTWQVFERVSFEIARVLKPGGVCVWNVADASVKGSETGSSFRQALHFKDTLNLNIHDTMIWQKPTFTAVGALKSRYAQVFEYMFVFAKGAPKTFNPIKDRPNKIKGKISGTIRQADGSMKPMWSAGRVRNEFGQRFNVWEMLPARGNWHPAPFPVTLAHDHIVSWSNPGDIVLDPFGGSGTTAVAAENAERRWICIERDEDYAAKAMERIRQHVSGDVPVPKARTPKRAALCEDSTHQASLSFG